MKYKMLSALLMLTVSVFATTFIPPTGMIPPASGTTSNVLLYGGANLVIDSGISYDQISPNLTITNLASEISARVAGDTSVSNAFIAADALKISTDNNEMDFAEKDALVILYCGQSQMMNPDSSGLSDWPILPDQADGLAGAYLYWLMEDSTAASITTNHFSGNLQPTDNQRSSSEQYFGRRLRELTGKDIYIVKFGSGGTSLPSKWAKSSAILYPYIGTAITNALTAFPNMPNRIDAFVWQQGEADVANSAAYPSNLVTFYNNVMTDYNGGTNAPIILPSLGTNYFNNVLDANGSAFCEVQKQYCLTNDNAYYVYCGDLPVKSDNLHYTVDGYSRAGERIAATIIGAINNISLSDFSANKLAVKDNAFIGGDLIIGGDVVGAVNRGSISRYNFGDGITFDNSLNMMGTGVFTNNSTTIAFDNDLLCGAVTFNGSTNSYLGIPTQTGATNMTFSYWYKGTYSTNADAVIVGLHETVTSAQFTIRHSTSGVRVRFLGQNQTFYNRYLNTDTYPEWHHLVLVLNTADVADGGRLYINGKYDSKRGWISPGANPAQPFNAIGAGYYAGGNPAAGYGVGSLAKVMYWKRLLSDQEIYDLYNAQKSGFIGVNKE